MPRKPATPQELEQVYKLWHNGDPLSDPPGAPMGVTAIGKRLGLTYGQMEHRLDVLGIDSEERAAHRKQVNAHRVRESHKRLNSVKRKDNHKPLAITTAKNIARKKYNTEAAANLARLKSESKLARDAGVA